MEFKRLSVTKLEDVVLMIQLTLMEETLDQLMVLAELALQPQPYQLTLLMASTLCNGRGSVALSHWETTTAVSTMKFLVDQLDHV